jgi:hypothetical protein
MFLLFVFGFDRANNAIKRILNDCRRAAFDYAALQLIDLV